MSKVIAFIDTYNSSGVKTKQEKASIISSVVKREGRRAVDTAEVTVSGNYQSDQNYELKYIQDIVDLTHLNFIANFQQTGRDEAGFDIWETNDTAASYPDFVKEGSTLDNKFRNRFVADLNGTTEFFKYDNPTWVHTGTPNVIDLSNDFDIYVWFKRITGEAGDSEHCLFSKWDNGVSGNGIEIFYEVGNFLTHDDQIVIRVRNNGTTASDIVATNPSFSPIHGSFTQWTLVRVKRTQGVISISVGGTNTDKPLTEHTTSANTNSFDNTSPIIIGANYAETGDFCKARLAQLRVYTGGVLSNTNANRVFGTRPQFFTTKLRGKVWKIEDKLQNKKLHIRGTGRIFLETIADPRDTGSGGIWASPAASWEVTARTGNYFEDEIGQDIIHDLVRSADNDFRIFSDLTLSSEVISKFVANGKLVQLIQIINTLEQDNADFFTYPHKVLLVEDPSKILVDQEFVHGENGVTIQADKKDNINLVNDITVIGAALTPHYVEPQLTGATGTTHALDFRPIGSVRVIKNGTQLSQVDDDLNTSIGASEFKIDLENQNIIFGSALIGGDTVDIEYDREPANMTTRKENSASKTEYGVFAKKIDVPQIRTVASVGSNRGLDVWATRFINKNKDVGKSYTVRIPSLINSIREGVGIYIANPLKRYNFTGRTLYDEKGDTVASNQTKLPIKAIEWKYPEAITTIKVGEWEYDYYELIKLTENTLEGIGSTTSKDKFN